MGVGDEWSSIMGARYAPERTATMTARGDVAEWLGRGLQSLAQRFESARRLPRLLSPSSRSTSSILNSPENKGSPPGNRAWGAPAGSRGLGGREAFGRRMAGWRLAPPASPSCLSGGRTRFRR